jgi:hypothetical protein
MTQLKANQNKAALALFLIIGSLIVLSLASCDPAKRIARIAKRHPELVKTDTVLTKVYDTVPAIAVKAEFKTNKDVSGIDSILRQLNGKIDSISRFKLGSEIKNYVVNRSIIQDTLTKVINGITIRLYQNGNDIGVLVDKPKEIRSQDVAVAYNTLAVKQSLTWSQKVKLWIWSNWWWVLGILWLVWKVFGKALKTYFPFLNFLK